MAKNNSLFSIACASPEKEEKDNKNYQKVGAWFLGPKAENEEWFQTLVKRSVEDHANFRKSYYENEEEYIDSKMKESDEYINMQNVLESKRQELTRRLKGSVPFFSRNYQAHMLWDTAIAGNIGYITAMLYNQNNVATEASPATSDIEMEVGKQLCELLGFKKDISWGHITADGTVANIEAMWAARNLKTYPLSVRDMIMESNDQNLKRAAADLKLTVCVDGKRVAVPILDCSVWQLLNVESEEALGLLDQLSSLSAVGIKELNDRLREYLLATKGIAYYSSKYPEIANMKVIVPATHHYSWPKAATILGMGESNVIKVKVDDNCRMDMNDLKKYLDLCTENQYPILMAVAVIGSTAEGAVDNLVAIHDERTKRSNLSFNLHCDGAWGGYLRTMVVGTKSDKYVNYSGKKEESDAYEKGSEFVPNLPLSDYARLQYLNIYVADTVTIDPHKAGFIPYAVGALCYRNKKMRNLITFNASYIQSDEDTNMGIYGLEGSKAGASAAAVWLAHETIPLNRSGYGLILGECSYSAKLNYCYWLSITGRKLKLDGIPGDYELLISPLISPPAKIERNNIRGFYSQEEIKDYILKNIIGKQAEEIAGNPRALMLLQNVGADVLMNAFAVNFKKDNIINKDIDMINKLTKNLFGRLSITKDDPNMEHPELILMMNTLSSKEYENAFAHIVKDWGLTSSIPSTGEYSLNVMVNTVMQPWPNTPEILNEMMNKFIRGAEAALADALSKK